jgi:hypothetical protein
MKDKKTPIIAVLFLLSVVNYSRIKGSENIRTIEFLSILSIGLLGGVLLVHIWNKFKK